MQIMPHKIFDTNTSKGETRVFEFLKRSYGEDKDFYVIHSLAITDPKTHKKWVEADFVLIRQNQVIVVEVKGGQVYQSEGQWTTINRNGFHSNLQESPVRQAHTCAQSIKRYLNKHLPANDVVTGHCVIFPDIKVNHEDISKVFGPELTTDICLCDLSSVPKFKNFIEHVFHYYSSNFSFSKTEHTTAELIVNALRPRMELLPFAQQISFDTECDIISVPAVSVLAEAIVNLSGEVQNLRCIVNRGLILGLTMASSISPYMKICLPIRFKPLINDNPYFEIDNVYYYFLRDENLFLVNTHGTIMEEAQYTFQTSHFLVLLDSSTEIKLSNHINEAILTGFSPKSLTTICNEVFASRANIPIVCQLPYLNNDFLKVTKTIKQKFTANIPCIMRGKFSIHRVTKGKLTKSFTKVLNAACVDEDCKNPPTVIFSHEEEFKLVSGLHNLTKKSFKFYQDKAGAPLEIFSKSPVQCSKKVILIIGYSTASLETSLDILAQILLRTEHQLDVIIDPCLDDYRAKFMVEN